MSNILEKADEITKGQRKHDYGSAEVNHTRTANLWNTYLTAKYNTSIELTAEDICYLNILQKITRDMQKAKSDNLVDIAGYARNIEIIRNIDETENNQFPVS